MLDLWERLKGYEPLWGGWTVARPIFSGGNSSVYLLERRRGDKTILCAMKAIPVLRGDGGDLQLRLARVMDEIERMELLGGCGYVVSFLDDKIIELRDESGKTEGYDVLIRMEYLACLAERMRDGEVMQEEEIVRLGTDICRALSAAHSCDIIHRDVKPANIYKTQFGRYKLGDFGVSRRISSEPSAAVTGTRAYMAPETARGDPSGRQSDIYSLGIVLYQLLNHNFLPFTGENSVFSEREDAAQRRWNGEALPPPKRGGKKLRAAVLKACQANPAGRYQSAEEFMSAINDAARRRTSRFAVPAAVFAAVLTAALILSPLFPLRQGPGYTTPETAPPQTTESATPAVSQSPAAPQKAGHRYEVISRKATWESAKVYCESQGGHLATITSRDEETEIIGLLEQKDVTVSWLGADNRNSSGGFRWITGEDFSYASWGVGEPNNTDGNEHCLMLVKKAGQGWVWNDAPDNGYDFYKSEELGFVCEWEDEE